VTTAADLLVRDGWPLADVVVLYGAGMAAPIASALRQLKEEFSTYPHY
jgi:hypothetical protein